MSSLFPNLASRVILTLRAHEAELRRAGVDHVCVFGSVARGEEAEESDIDLAVELDPKASIGLIGLVGLEERLSALLGRKVDLTPGPVEKQRLRDNIARDALYAF